MHITLPAEPNDLVALGGLGFLLIGGVLLVHSVWRGRRVCHSLAERFPELYTAAGSPRPSYFNSARRIAYFRFLMQQRFWQTPDPSLVEAFEVLRRIERRGLIFLLVGFAGLGVAFLWLEGWLPS